MCYRWPVLLIAAWMLAGCTEDGPADRLEDYQQRLARSLDVALPLRPAAIALPIPPRSGQLQIPIDSAKLDTLDFLALTGCEIQITIGKRNSSLGRLARPSQRLLLDLEFLRGAEACIQWQEREGKPRLAELLRQAQQLKRRQLPAQIFNATLGSREYRELWRRPSLLGNYPANTGSVVLQSLQAINADVARWLSGDYTADGQGFELHLYEVSKGDGGALIAALSLQQRELTRADKIVAKQLARGPLCTPVSRPQAATVADTVVRKFLIGRVQPWSAALDRRYRELLPPLRELEQQLNAALPQPFTLWRAALDEFLAAAVDAPRRHVQALQTLLGPCRVLPS